MSIVGQRQAPLRRHYRQQPQRAMITKRVRTGGSPAADPFHGTVTPDNLADAHSPYGVQWHYGIDRAVGGLHDAPNPGEMLCAALAACADSTVRMIADLIGVELDELEVEVDGRLDVRGALMIDPTVPVGFQHLNVAIRVRPDDGTPSDRLDHLAAAAERCCLVLDTLRNGVPIDVRFETCPDTVESTQTIN
jgi:uncharacterized OsmC-like protein